MKRRLLWVTLITAALVLCKLLAFGQITSNFNTGTDGWQLINDGDNDTLAVTHDPTGGVTGGRLVANTPTDNYPDYFWYAPEKFRGNLTYSSLGLTFTWSQQQLVTGNNSEFNGNYYEAYSEDVEIRSGNNTIYLHTSPKPSLTPGWSTFSFTLDETSPWRTGATASAPLATRDQIKRALQNVTVFRIRGNFNLTANTIALDDVSVGVHPTLTSPTITTVSPLQGLPGDQIVITGTNFDAANLAAYFGGVQADVVSASATQITVEVPSGAMVSNIVVANTSTNLSVASSVKFSPKFEGGGRIIRNSFKPTFYFNMDPSAGDIITRIGDIDGDGKNDIVVCESSLGTVSVLRNLGAGGTITASSFATKVSVAGSGAIQLADFNNDGKLDLNCQLSGSFAFYKNTSTPGNVSFDPTPSFVSGVGNLGGIHAADIDGDGRTEFLATHSNGSVAADFYIAQNISRNGSIEFAPILSYFGGSMLDAGASVTSGDLDGDGKPEIAVASSFAGRFHVIRNTSVPGTISLETPFLVNNTASKSIIIADLDGDGKNDLAWSGDSDNDISIRRNIYSGGAFDDTAFGTRVIITAPIGYIQGGLGAGDINGDGKIDLVQGGSSDQVIYENVSVPGSITTSSFVAGIPVRGSDATYPSGPVIGDLNGDNKPEILFGSMNNTPRIFLYENQNYASPHISLNTVSPLKGAIGSTVTITGNNFSTTPSENIVRFGAVHANVLTATETELTVAVPAGATYAPVTVTRNLLTSSYHLPFSVTFGSGTTFDATSFAPAVNFTVTNADYDIDIGDFDVDGKPDVMVEGTVARILQNTHTSGSISTSSLTAAAVTSANSTNPRLVDLDGDGKLDIVSGNGASRNSSTATISFEAQSTATANGALAVSFADFDRDGKTDLVASGSGANVAFYYNWTRGAIPFAALGANYLDPMSDAINYAKTGTGGSPVAIDFDKDGNTEFASTSSSTDNVRIWSNSGGHTPVFTVVTDIAVGDNPGRLYWGDLDADGLIDLAMYHGTGTSSSSITVIRNTSTLGSISFAAPQVYAIGSVGTTMAIADVDGDAKPELLVVGEAADRLSIFKNTSAPGTLDASSFAAPFHYTIDGPRAVAAADLDLDGKPELLVARSGSLLSVLANAIPTGPSITIDTQPSFTYACEGSSATFTAIASGTTNITYHWQKFDGSVFVDLNDGSGYSGVSTSTLTINTGTTSFAGSGNYRCRINGDLATEVFSDDANLTINSIPPPPDVTGATGCVSPTTVTLTASGASDGDYNWYDVPTAGSVLETNGAFVTPSITATKTFYVSIRDTFCESERVEVDATITLLTKPAVGSSDPIVNSNIDICDGEDCTLSVPGTFVNYVWSNGSTGQEITVDAEGSYTVTVEDSNGCTSPPSDPITVTVNNFPDAEITANGTTLTASNGDDYQWYQGGTSISGATQQNFEFNVLEYGIYTVDVTNNGCTSTSDEFVYLITGAEEVVGNLRLYPNPVKEDLYIESHKDVTLEISDITGKCISVPSLNEQGEGIVQMNGLAPGVYILRVQSSTKKRYIRIVKE
jgi:hypothetical protein